MIDWYIKEINTIDLYYNLNFINLCTSRTSGFTGNFNTLTFFYQWDQMTLFQTFDSNFFLFLYDFSCNDYKINLPVIFLAR